MGNMEGVANIGVTGVVYGAGDLNGGRRVRYLVVDCHAVFEMERYKMFENVEHQRWLAKEILGFWTS